MNRITQHFDELEFIECLERCGCVKIEHVPHGLTPVEPRGQLAVPDFDCAHNVAGVGTVRECETPEEERRRIDVGPVCFAAGVSVLMWSLAGWLVGRWWR